MKERTAVKEAEKALIQCLIEAQAQQKITPREFEFAVQFIQTGVMWARQGFDAHDAKQERVTAKSAAKTSTKETPTN
jgi:hypothetical protein